MTRFATTSIADTDLIEKIAIRAVADPHAAYADKMTAMIEIIIVHTACVPLDLCGLLNAADDEFRADIEDIARHLDRDNFCLRDGFMPRWRKP